MIGGQTNSSNFPTTPGAAQTTLSATGIDGFLARIDAARGRLLYATLCGGPGGVTDLVCVTPGPLGDVYAAGWTIATSLPEAVPNTRGDAADLFVGRFGLLPDGIERFGTDSANCGGPIFAGVSERPAVGSTAFALMCTGIPTAATPPFGLGAVLFAATPVPRGSRLGAPFGVTLYLGLPALAAAPMVVDARGFAEIPLPLNGVPQGVTVFAQFSWLNPTACGSTSLLSASDALQVSTR